MKQHEAICVESHIGADINDPPIVTTELFDTEDEAMSKARRWFAEVVNTGAQNGDLAYARFDAPDKSFKVCFGNFVFAISCVQIGCAEDEDGADTPLMCQYLALKRELPEGTILMFRLGDFYEAFGEDAVVASPIMGATLACRGKRPMCGVPFHAIDKYIAKLVKVGKSVALSEAVEAVGDGVPRREITRIVTPGTFNDENKEEQK